MTKISYEQDENKRDLPKHLKELRNWLIERYETPTDALALLSAMCGVVIAMMLEKPEKSAELQEKAAEALVGILKAEEVDS